MREWIEQLESMTDVSNEERGEEEKTMGVEDAVWMRERKEEEVMLTRVCVLEGWEVE